MIKLGDEVYIIRGNDLKSILDYYLSDIKESTNKPHHTETTSTIINNHTSTDDVWR